MDMLAVLVPSECWEGKYLPFPSPSFWWYADNLWPPLLCSPPPSSLHGVFPVCMSLCPKFPSWCRIALYQIKAHPNGLILNNYICKDPISIEGHILRYL